MITQILFEIPTMYEAAVRSGSLLQIGGLLKDAGTGQIIAHLQESGLAQSLIGKAMLGAASPATLLVGEVLNGGTGIYNAVQIAQVKEMVAGLVSLQIATAGIALVGVAVSAAGFIYMRKRFNALDEKIDRILDTMVTGFDAQQKANLRSHLSQVSGYVQQAQQAHTLSNPQKEYSRLAERLASEASHFEGELEFVVKVNGKINHEMFWQLAQALMVCNSVRIDCRIRTNELLNAIDVSTGIADRYQNVFGLLTPMSFDIAPELAVKTVTTLKDITDVAATKPYLLDYLHSRRVDGAEYLNDLAQETERPLLMLKVQ